MQKNIHEKGIRKLWKIIEKWVPNWSKNRPKSVQKSIRKKNNYHASENPNLFEIMAGYKNNQAAEGGGPRTIQEGKGRGLYNVLNRNQVIFFR